MKPFARWVRIAAIFVRKDWTEFRTPIALLTASLVAPVLMLAFETARPDLARGMIAGGLVAAPFFYAQSCFYMERQRGKLGLLLSLPITRTEFVLAKYASLYSMTLFTVNVPGILLGNLRMLFCANAAAIFFATVFMSSTVVSDKPWAPQIPFFAVILATMPLVRNLSPSLLRWASANSLHLAFFALLLTPAVVLISAWIFAREP